MKIRKARLKDAKEILKIINQSYNLRGNNKEDYELKDVQNYISSKINRFLVCELDYNVVGFIIAQFWKTYVYVHLVAVDTKHQGRGIGKRLFDEIEKLAFRNKKEVIEAFTELENKKVKSMLAHRGYKQGKNFIFFSKRLR